MSGENLPNLSLLDDNDSDEDSNTCGGRNDPNQNNCADFSLPRPPPRSPSRTPRVARPPQTSLSQNTNYSNNNNRPLDRLFSSSLRLDDTSNTNPISHIVRSVYGEPMFTTDDSDDTSSHTNPPQSLGTQDELMFTSTDNNPHQSQPTQLAYELLDSHDTDNTEDVEDVEIHYKLYHELLEESEGATSTARRLVVEFGDSDEVRVMHGDEEITNTCDPIEGDGDCMFRCLSQSGSELHYLFYKIMTFVYMLNQPFCSAISSLREVATVGTAVSCDVIHAAAMAHHVNIMLFEKLREVWKRFKGGRIPRHIDDHDIYLIENMTGSIVHTESQPDSTPGSSTEQQIVKREVIYLHHLQHLNIDVQMNEIANIEDYAPSEIQVPVDEQAKREASKLLIKSVMQIYEQIFKTSKEILIEFAQDSSQLNVTKEVYDSCMKCIKERKLKKLFETIHGILNSNRFCETNEMFLKLYQLGISMRMFIHHIRNAQFGIETFINSVINNEICTSTDIQDFYDFSQLDIFRDNSPH